MILTRAGFSGTDGYAAEAPTLFDRYERRSFDEVHAAILDLMPPGGRALDIGAGTGRDAGALAARGFAVTAVEPIAELREPARTLHPSPAIEWIDDGLPELATLIGRAGWYDLVLATAVWMHLDEAERATAMDAVAPLVGAGGILSITLRRGAVPAGRRMFHVDPEEPIAQAAAHGLTCVLDDDEPSIGADNLAAGVSWRRVVFRR